jgi:hypothetical protein
MNVLSMGNPAGDHQPVEEEQRATVEGEKAASPRQTFPDSARVMPKRANVRYRAPRSRGSSRSRKASPNMLNPNTAALKATPGQIANQGAWYM